MSMIEVYRVNGGERKAEKSHRKGWSICVWRYEIDAKYAREVLESQWMSTDLSILETRLRERFPGAAIHVEGRANYAHWRRAKAVRDFKTKNIVGGAWKLVCLESGETIRDGLSARRLGGYANEEAIRITNFLDLPLDTLDIYILQ